MNDPFFADYLEQPEGLQRKLRGELSDLHLGHFQITCQMWRQKEAI